MTILAQFKRLGKAHMLAFFAVTGEELGAEAIRIKRLPVVEPILPDKGLAAPQRSANGIH